MLLNFTVRIRLESTHVRSQMKTRMQARPGCNFSESQVCVSEPQISWKIMNSGAWQEDILLISKYLLKATDSHETTAICRLTVSGSVNLVEQLLQHLRNLKRETIMKCATATTVASCTAFRSAIAKEKNACNRYFAGKSISKTFTSLKCRKR